MAKLIGNVLVWIYLVAGISFSSSAQNINATDVTTYDLKKSKTWQSDGWLLYNPSAIATIGDYIIIIDRKEGNQILILNKQNQKLVTTLGRQGRGPGEFIGPWELIASRKGNEQFLRF